MHPTQVADDPVRRALEECDLAGFENRIYTQLSGGEQRRVLLARPWATEAPVVLMDEPTAALDIAHALALIALLRRLAKTQRTIVVVVHDLNEAAQLCDEIVLLKDGGVFGAGPTADWIAQGPVRDVFGVDPGPSGLRLPTSPTEETSK